MPQPPPRSNPWQLADGHDEGWMWMAWLVRLRWVAIVAQIVTVSFTFGVLDRPAIVLPGMAVAIGMLGIANMWAIRQLHDNEPIGQGALLSQLLLDVFVLTGFFMAAGGASNPFVLVYLIHVGMAAVMLETRQAVALMSAVIVANVALHFWNLPLHPERHELGQRWLMAIGETVAFTVTVLSVGGFVAGTGRSLRHQKHRLIEARDRTAQTDRLRAVGTLAAGAAHELNTPLSTIGLRLRRVARRHDDADTVADLEVMKAQLERCTEIVEQLLVGAGDPSSSGIERGSLQEIVRRGVHLWSLGSHLDVKLVLQEEDIAVELPGVAFLQALTNMLENAREAQLEAGVIDPLEVQIRREGRYGVVRILDRGPGLPPESDRIGEPFFTTKSAGTGLGVFVARAVANGAGGGLSYAREEGRTVARWYVRESGRAA